MNLMFYCLGIVRIILSYHKYSDKKFKKQIYFQRIWINIIEVASIKQIPVFKFIDSPLKYQVRKAKENIPNVNVKNLLGHIDPPNDSVTIPTP